MPAELSILNSSGASPGDTKKIGELEARASCSGASHSSELLQSAPLEDRRTAVETLLARSTTNQKTVDCKFDRAGTGKTSIT